jgi:hypothetical protein
MPLIPLGVFATERSTWSQMSAASAVLSVPDALSNNSPRTWARTWAKLLVQQPTIPRRFRVPIRQVPL